MSAESERPAKGRNRRKGAAVAELAICLPLLFLIIFGSIEACNLIFLKQAITAAAYEGSLLGIRAGSTEAEVLQRVQDVLDARNIASTTTSINGPAATLEATPAGEIFSVRVEASTAANLVSPKLFAQFNTVAVDVAARKQ